MLISGHILKNLLYSIEMGLTSFGMDVTSYSFDFLFVLATHAFKKCAPESEVMQLLRPFLKLVLDLIISQQVNSDMLQVASASLYILICAFQVSHVLQMCYSGFLYLLIKSIFYFIQIDIMIIPWFELD
jgi:hypothetical protein